MTLDELRLFVQEGASSVASDFDSADDDWEQIAFYVTAEGLAVMPLPNAMFASGATKDVLSHILRTISATADVLRYAVLLNVHMVALSPEDKDVVGRVRREEIRIQQLPESIEQLMLTVGDAEQEEVWVARIERDEQGVRRLQAWEPFGEGGVVGGRFTGLNEAMRQPR